MADRYFAPDLSSDDECYTLEGTEAHHLRSVCRAKVGDRIELFDGQGKVAVAEIVEIHRHETTVRIHERQELPASGFALNLACALPKGDRGIWLVEKCVELGVTRLAPLRTERSVTDPGENKLEKFRRTVVEACKQSRRAHLMTIGEPRTWNEFLDTAPAGWVMDPRGTVYPSEVGAAPLWVAIGPEGGWTEEELEKGTGRGWVAVRVPGNILRVETAAVAIAAWGRLCQGIH